MKVRKKRYIFFGLVMLMILCFSVNTYAEDAEDTQEIGVVVYNPDSLEMQMFIEYYRDYLEEGFPVKFYFSDVISTWEEEEAYLIQLRNAGVKGVISFYTCDLKKAVDFCAENEMYYVMGFNTIEDSDYEKLKNNPWFLGTVGAKQEDASRTGKAMTEYFLEKGASSFLIMSGAAGKGNILHTLRTEAMLETLEEAGVVFDAPVEEIAPSTEYMKFASVNGAISVVLCPGSTENGNGLENLQRAFAEGDYDALMSAFHTSTYLDVISKKETQQKSNILVGSIDSFTMENFEKFKEKDSFGNAKLDYLEGKYASMAGPAFALMFNALTGHPEANTSDGNAVQLFMGFWTAKSDEEFEELYGYSRGIYENAYSCMDLMRVIKVYNEKTSFDDLKNLTEAYSIEDVKKRIFGW